MCRRSHARHGADIHAVDGRNGGDSWEVQAFQGRKVSIFVPSSPTVLKRKFPRRLSTRAHQSFRAQRLNLKVTFTVSSQSLRAGAATVTDFLRMRSRGGEPRSED